MRTQHDNLKKLLIIFYYYTKQKNKTAALKARIFQFI